MNLSTVDDSLYFMCQTDSFKFLADMIQHVPLPLRVRYVFCCSPIDRKIPFICNMFLKVCLGFPITAQVDARVGKLMVFLSPGNCIIHLISYIRFIHSIHSFHSFHSFHSHVSSIHCVQLFHSFINFFPTLHSFILLIQLICHSLIFPVVYSIKTIDFISSIHVFHSFPLFPSSSNLYCILWVWSVIFGPPSFWCLVSGYRAICPAS